MMKYFFIVLFLNLLLATAAVAQVQVGLKAGPMLANTVVTDIDSIGPSDPKLSYMIGGFLTMPFTEKISLQVELLYANKGLKTEYYIGSSTSPLDGKINLHYVSLPVLLQYKVIDRLKIEAGPEVSYLLGAYSVTSINGELDSYKDIDVGIDVGVGYDLTEKLVLGLRYNLGLYDISEDILVNVGNGNTFVVKSRLHNRTLQLSLGYKLVR